MYQIKTLHTLKFKQKKKNFPGQASWREVALHVLGAQPGHQSLLGAVVKTQAHNHRPTHAQAETGQAYAVYRPAFLVQTTPF